MRSRVVEALKCAAELHVTVFWLAPLVFLIGNPQGIFQWMASALVSPAGALLVLCIVSVSVAHEVLKLKRLARIDSAEGANGAKPSHRESAKTIIVNMINLGVVVLPNYALLAFLWSFPDTLLGAAFWVSIAWFFLVVFLLNLIRPRRLGFMFPPRSWRFGHPPP